MTALLMMAASIWMSTPAHAVTFNCQGMNSTTATVQLQCDDTNCLVNGTVFDTNVSREPIAVTSCTGTRRHESPANRYQRLAYYDVTDKQCWANYIRVAKDLDKDGNVQASLVETGGGDQHDYSGYQYLYLVCKIQP